MYFLPAAGRPPGYAAALAAADTDLCPADWA
jgi:hypothetical protein